MRKLGLLLMLLLLPTAAGCRALATAGVIAGEVAIDYAVSRYDDCAPCDRHSVETPTRRCR